LARDVSAYLIGLVSEKGLLGVPAISGYTVFETLWHDRDLALFRGRCDADQSPILLEAARRADADPRVTEKLEHEFSLRADLDPAWALMPVRLERVQGRLYSIFDDPGGNTLSRLLHEPRSVGESLHLAVGLAGALGRLHARGLVHKDIKPDNVLLDPTGKVRLRGFAFASRLPRERQEPGRPAEGLAGSLPYMSPEQTGRMNRSVDSRTDLYSLGVTLYELFTGNLPFGAHEPLEWIHCHIAR
jgi:serine/threonine protein kinase